MLGRGTAFSFARESSLLPVWEPVEKVIGDSDLFLAEDPAAAETSAEEEEEERLPLRNTPNILAGKRISHRPVFDAMFLCLKDGDRGIRILKRTERTLELDIYDSRLFYHKLQRSVVKQRQTTDVKSRIKSLRRYFEPIDKGTHWSETTARLTIRLKTNCKTACIAYRDAAKRYKF